MTGAASQFFYVNPGLGLSTMLSDTAAISMLTLTLTVCYLAEWKARALQDTTAFELPQPLTSDMCSSAVSMQAGLIPMTPSLNCSSHLQK